jgi:ABC-type multidrug transport system fused ATPase/permease subunit
LKGIITERFAGIATIWAFARERHEEERHAELSNQALQAGFAIRRRIALIDPVTEGLSVAVLVALLASATLAHMPLSVLVTFIFMLYRVQPQVKSLENNRALMMANSAGIEDVMAFLDPSDKAFMRSGSRPFTALKDEIRLDAVTFKYPTKQAPAVENVSFSIKRGTMTALVGPSGAGKSTLVSLISAFHAPTRGTILVDGTPLHEFDLRSWRGRLAVVSQDPLLFATSIRENILYSRPEASDEEIVDAARRAHAHEFICALPDQYQTIVGDRGVRLSGGQRQRIAIARALLRQADLLILDEATNELDGLSEELIRETIVALRPHCTILAIAHRLSTIQEADQLIVLDNGRLAEQGRHAELVERNGLFAKLYRSQGVVAATAPRMKI